MKPLSKLSLGHSGSQRSLEAKKVASASDDAQQQAPASCTAMGTPSSTDCITGMAQLPDELLQAIVASLPSRSIAAFMAVDRHCRNALRDPALPARRWLLQDQLYAAKMAPEIPAILADSPGPQILAHMRKLDLSAMGFQGERLKTGLRVLCRHAQQLTMLDLSENLILGSAIAESKGEWRGLTKLRALNLSFNPLGKGDTFTRLVSEPISREPEGAVLDAIGCLTDLRVLNLVNTGFTQAYTLRAGLRCLQQLTWLDISGAEIYQQPIDVPLPALRHLSLSRNYDNEGTLPLLTRLSGLTSLDLSQACDAQQTCIAALTELRRLARNHTVMYTDTLQAIGSLPYLTHLEMHGGEFNDSHLPALLELTRLKTLDLRWAVLSDASVQSLKAKLPARLYLDSEDQPTWEPKTGPNYPAFAAACRKASP